jgi:NADPH-dependent 7-cyano-7-deazaguanine reductase QueF
MSADPTLLRLVAVDSTAEVTVTSPLVHRCPFVPEVDTGTVTITWRCEMNTVELHSLAAYLASWADQTISSEEITEQIMRDLEQQLDGIQAVSVGTAWETAGMKVSIYA